MATKVVMEALSPTMEEGRLVEWKKSEGDKVATGDVLAEVETDKAVMELAARADGVLLRQVVAAGDTVPVAEVVGWIGDAGEEIPEAEPAAPAGSAVGAQHVAPDVATDDEPGAAPDTTPAAPPSAPSASDGRIKASPVARRMASERGIDLASLSGTGPEGRIIKRDIESAPAAPAAGFAFTPTAAGGSTDVPLTQMRKTIAKRLVQSIGPVPTFYLTTEVDMEQVWNSRKALIERDPDARFSFNDILIRTAAAALPHHPFVNSWWLDDKIRQWHEVHIGVAVAIDEGLITPVVRHANQKGLRQISAEVRELAERAHAKRLKPEEYTGATFTISNLGMMGIDEFTAIINPPEVAILAVGRIGQKPVAMNGEVVLRRKMRMTLSCDHRVVDGATGAAFLQTLVGMLENPLALVW